MMIEIKAINCDLIIYFVLYPFHNKYQWQHLRPCKTLIKNSKRKRGNKRNHQEYQKTYSAWINWKKSSWTKCSVQRNQLTHFIYLWARGGKHLSRRGKLLISLTLIIIMYIVSLAMARRILLSPLGVIKVRLKT